MPRAELTDWSKFFLSWRIGMLDVMDPSFGWQTLDQTKLDYIRKKLCQFEGMTLAQIFTDGKKQHHAICVKDICADAKRRLAAIGHEDLDQLHRLRLMGKERVWGVLRCNTLSLLWWDPEHLIYPYELPNT